MLIDVAFAMLRATRQTPNVNPSPVAAEIGPFWLRCHARTVNDLQDCRDEFPAKHALWLAVSLRATVLVNEAGRSLVRKRRTQTCQAAPLSEGELVRLIVVRNPDPARWNLAKMAGFAAEDDALATAGLASWSDGLDAEDSA